MEDDPPPPPNDPPPPPSDPPPPLPPPPPNNPPADSGDRLGRLEDLVAGLVETVTKLLPSDDPPIRKPWTHKGSRER